MPALSATGKCCAFSRRHCANILTLCLLVFWTFLSTLTAYNEGAGPGRIAESASSSSSTINNATSVSNVALEGERRILKSKKRRKEKSKTSPSTKIAYVFAGAVRSFVCPKVHWTIRTNLIDALGGEPYVFVRVSTEDNLNIKTGVGQLWKPEYGSDEVDETLKILNPREIQRFTFKDQVEEMKKEYPSDIHAVFRENDQRRYSMFFHRCMAYRMVLKYEALHSMRFDWVALVRLDAAWLEPVLPIQMYQNDRVWLTETGYTMFNDQFMLIPRQFSDFLYDLDSKINKDVYCLGGPDVEQWKCDPEKLQVSTLSERVKNISLSYCCTDVLGRNKLGYSETIHFRHLESGQIPVSMGYFPVLLARIARNNAAAKFKCNFECDRLLFNTKKYIFRFVTTAYRYFMPLEWPGTRSTSLSYADETRCLMAMPSPLLWKAFSAHSLHSSGQPPQQQPPQRHRHLHQQVDYSQSLMHQLDAVHPSIFMNPRDIDVFRIHPSSNNEGCLTFPFPTTGLHKAGPGSEKLEWTDCKDHLKLKGGFRFHPAQLFFVHVIPHSLHGALNTGETAAAAGVIGEVVQLADSSDGSDSSDSAGARHVHLSLSRHAQDYVQVASYPNTTRIMMPEREPRWLVPRGWRYVCLEATALTIGSSVIAAPCASPGKHEAAATATTAVAALPSPGTSSILTNDKRGGSGLFVSGFVAAAAAGAGAVGLPSAYERQLFNTVRGRSSGSHHHSTVGQLSMALRPELCVSRALEGMRPSDQTVYRPSNGNLKLDLCSRDLYQDRMRFEFEQVA